MGVVNKNDSFLWLFGIEPPSKGYVWLKDDGILYIWSEIDGAWRPSFTISAPVDGTVESLEFIHRDNKAILKVNSTVSGSKEVIIEEATELLSGLLSSIDKAKLNKAITTDNLIAGTNIEIIMNEESIIISSTASSGKYEIETVDPTTTVNIKFRDFAAGTTAQSLVGKSYNELFEKIIFETEYPTLTVPKLTSANINVNGITYTTSNNLIEVLPVGSSIQVTGNVIGDLGSIKIGIGNHFIFYPKHNNINYIINIIFIHFFVFIYMMPFF